MSMHEGLPVAGYQPQSQSRVDAVNENKITEETVLRSIDRLQALGMLDPRCASLAKTRLEEGFMWLNRAVFQPARISLPGDQT